VRVALIGPTPPPNGGMAMQTQQLHRLLTSDDHEVELIATNAAYRPHFVAKIPVVRALFRLCAYLFYLIANLKRFDIIHLMANSGWSFYLFAMPVIYIANWHKVPVVMNYRGGLADEFFTKDWRWIKGAINTVDKIIVPSGFLQEVFAKFEVNTTVVPNIVDLSVFDFHVPTLQSDSLHVVVTRNLEQIYDNKTAIEGFALFHQHHPNARLSIAGTGEQEGMLKQLVKQLDLQHSVRFLGRLDRNEIAQLYRQADILLNTSLVDNTPNSIIEALACGLVVISSDVGGIPYLVKHQQHALLVPPRCPSAVAQQLNAAIESVQASLTIARQGHNMVIEFTPEIVIPLLTNIYRELT